MFVIFSQRWLYSGIILGLEPHVCLSVMAECQGSCQPQVTPGILCWSSLSCHLESEKKPAKYFPVFWFLCALYSNSVHSWYESSSDVGEIRVWFASKILTPCRMHWNDFLIAQIIAKCHSFPNVCDIFSPKKHLKTAFFCGKIWTSPHFGKTWRPNCWHQVNFWGTPEKFGV